MKTFRVLSPVVINTSLIAAFSLLAGSSVASAATVPPGIVINEIHYNPPSNPIREEFVELFNASNADVDLTLWSLRGGIDYRFPAGTMLPRGGFLIVAENPAVIQARYGVMALGPWTGAINNDGERITLRNPSDVVMDEVDFRSEFPWPIAPNGGGASMQLVNPALDNDLGGSWRAGTPATPGRTNVVFATNAAPQLRQVDHSPNSPASTNAVVITCKATDSDGVASVTLAYQVVAPGDYIPATLPLSRLDLNRINANPNLTNALNPAFEAPTNWTSVVMRDDGLNGDVVAGDTIFTAVLPPQPNRTLVRYRITVADKLGASRRAPFEDDPSLNFAFYVYNGIPAYQGITPEQLQTLPVYTLITRAQDLTQCTAWTNSADQLSQDLSGQRNLGRLHFNWEGAMVYDGVVYDHITYRLRGANGRYHPGKRSIRYRFNDGRLLAAKDQRGNRFPTKWRELTTGKGQSNRGSETFALNEVVNYFLWNKVSVPAPFTFHFHFRVVRGPEESPTNRFNGDFWGLNWAQEKYDVNFLTAHAMPKGNLYKLVDNYVLGTDERRYQGPFAVTNATDFTNVEVNLTGNQSVPWLLAHANYTNWYRYFTVAEAIRHYDIWPSANKNGAWYFEPIYTPANNFLGRMMQLPYDSTDTWGPTWNNGEDILFNGIFPSSATGGDPGQHPELQLEYRNVVRELRDLLFRPDQIIPLIDAFAAPLRDVAAADFLRWSNATPSGASYSALLIPGTPGATRGLAGVAEDMKNFMFRGGTAAWWIDRNTVSAGGWITRLDAVAGADTNVPTRPMITYTGLPGFPVDGLVFESSAFADPQGAGTFAAMQWRLAEITPTNTPVAHPGQLKFEYDAVWDSGELPAFNARISVPQFAVASGRSYRARVRHKDTTGRWSRWSEAVEFIAVPGDTVLELRGALAFSEIMYNPLGAPGVDSDEFEYLKLKNLGTNTLDLSGLSFSSGINFAFTNGTTLAPGATFLLARSPTNLLTRYPGLVVNGVYAGKLNNDGETLTIRDARGFEVLSVTYSDGVPWPLTADGFGFSLVLDDPVTRRYRASTRLNGSPGANDPAPTVPGIVINEVLSSSTPPAVDRIELFNPTSAAVDVSGWYLTDDAKVPKKFRIPNGTSIPAGGYLVFDETQFNFLPGLPDNFALSSLGDDVYLFSANTNGDLTGYSHGFVFGGASDGVSFGRYLNSVREELFPPVLLPTFGSGNAVPKVGKVFISEIQYNPAPGGDEFLELYNSSANAISLFDPTNATNRWQINGIGYTFPPNSSLGAGEVLVLVPIDPVAFRAKYSVPASVQIFGPYSGGLQDNGERLEVLQPDAPTTNGVPYFAIDEVRYNDRTPWPTAADGTGASLQRHLTLSYGNDPTNWFAAVATPGRLWTGGERPTIVTSPQSRTVVATRSTTFQVTATGLGPLFYQWRFNGNRLAGQTNATLILTNVQAAQAGTYTVDIFNAGSSVSSAPAMLTVLIPATITQQPASLTVRPFTNVTFSVGAASRTPVSYQWQFNGVNIPGATAASYSIGSVDAGHAGAYQALVTDAIGTVSTAPATLVVLIDPTIVEQPAAAEVPAGGSVTLSVLITNTATLPLTYRWRRNGTSVVTNTLNQIVGAITLTNVQADGDYTVVVANAARPSGIISGTARVTVVADTDRDGLPDSWETAFGFNPNNAADATLDSDGDRVSNRDEYVAGTDPKDPNSYLRIERFSGPPATATIEFIAAANRTYTVEFTDALGTATWTKLADVAMRPSRWTERVFDAGSQPGRFYRLATPLKPTP